jgi:endonuclease YncB( thermonuclease family)
MARSLLSAIVAFALQSAHGTEWTLSGRVVALKDGETFVMLDGKTQHPIRIAGIDAPERRQRPTAPLPRTTSPASSSIGTLKPVAISGTDTAATCAACSATKGRT